MTIIAALFIAVLILAFAWMYRSSFCKPLDLNKDLPEQQKEIVDDYDNWKWNMWLRPGGGFNWFVNRRKKK
jgi:hypothetical protein